MKSSISPPQWEYLFHPRSVAVVGISTTNPNNWASNWVKTLVELGFEGKVYPVGLNLSQVFGLRAYPSLNDIPDIIDYVIVSIPARSAPQLMKDCVAKGVKFVHLYTAGFSETGEEEGIKLEAEILEIARKGGVRIIGPNSMGIHCPANHLSWRLDFTRQAGAVSFLSQSGWNAADLIKLGAVQGIYFSKVISYGNACDLNEADFLEYLAHDTESKIIAAYIEGVKQGQRFFRVLKEATKIKPVIILKGGRSEAGLRAVMSHTGSLGGTERIWRSLFQQSGAIRVYNFDELADAILAFSYLSAPKGKRVAVIGSGGGPSVHAADECENAGLAVPPLPTETREELSKLIPVAGTSFRNPIDSPFMLSNEQFRQMIRIVAALPQTDLLIIHLGIDFPLAFPGGRQKIREQSEAIISAVKGISHPAAIVLRSCRSTEAWETIAAERERFAQAGLPLYHSIPRAAQALSKLACYYQRLEAD